MIKLTPEKPPYYEIIPTAPLPSVVLPNELVLFLTQTGAGNPVVTNIKNQLTFLTILRTAAGIYTISFLIATLTANKTVGFTNLTDGAGAPKPGYVERTNGTTAQILTTTDEWRGNVTILVYL